MKRLFTIITIWLLLLPAAITIAGDKKATIELTFLERKLIPQMAPPQGSIETLDAWAAIEDVVKLSPSERKAAYRGVDEKTGLDLWDLTIVEPQKKEFTIDLVKVIMSRLKYMSKQKELPIHARELYHKFKKEAKKHGLF